VTINARFTRTLRADLSAPRTRPSLRSVKKLGWFTRLRSHRCPSGVVLSTSHGPGPRQGGFPGNHDASAGLVLLQSTSFCEPGHRLGEDAASVPCDGDPTPFNAEKAYKDSKLATCSFAREITSAGMGSAGTDLAGEFA